MYKRTLVDTNELLTNEPRDKMPNDGLLTRLYFGFWLGVFLGFGLGLLEKVQFLAKIQKQLPLFDFATCNYRYQKMLDQKKNEKKITQMRVHTCTIITFGFCCATTV